jgi:hypothetical protein
MRNELSHWTEVYLFITKIGTQQIIGYFRLN